MITSTTAEIPGRSVTEVIGVVTGCTVRSTHEPTHLHHLHSQMGSELTNYTELFAVARNEAIARMVEAAENQGADAIVVVRFTSSSITEGASELLAYGTAVKLDQ